MTGKQNYIDSMRSAHIQNPSSGQFIEEYTPTGFELMGILRNELSQLPNCVAVQNPEIKEEGFVFSPQHIEEYSPLQITSFHIRTNLLPGVIRITIQPTDPLPKEYRLESIALPAISQVNTMTCGDFPSATLVWNSDTKQISALGMLTFQNLIFQNDFCLRKQLRENIVKGLINRLQMGWKLIQKRSISQNSQQSTSSPKVEDEIKAKIIKKAKQKHHPLDLLRFHFEESRKKRQLSTGNKIDLNSLKINSIFKYLTLLQEASHNGNFQIVKKQLQTVPKLCPNIAKEYFQKCVSLYHQKQAEVLKGKQKICRGIKFSNIPSRNKLETQGAFSETYLLTNCQYAIKFSLYQMTTLQAQKMLGSQPIEQKCDPLVQKTYSEFTAGSKVSFQTEKNMVFMMRGDSCPSIALYYLNQVTQGLSNIQQIYCHYYQGDSKELGPSSKGSKKIRKLLQFMKGLAEGIHFLSQNGIIHRDLKPDNIRIDKKKFPKIIDFGSACPAYGSRLEQKLSKQYGKIARMTRGYFLEYHTLPDYVKNLFFPPEVFERHIYSDIYAFGVIFGKFFPEGTLKGEIMNEGFSQKIKLLQSKCLEPNPADRWAPIEMVIYLEALIKTWDKMCGQ